MSQFWMKINALKSTNSSINISMTKLKEYYEDVFTKPNLRDPERDRIASERVNAFIAKHKGISFDSLKNNQIEMKQIIYSLGVGKSVGNAGISNENLLNADSLLFTFTFFSTISNSSSTQCSNGRFFQSTLTLHLLS